MAYVYTPYENQNQIIVSQDADGKMLTFKHKGYRYLRFYCEAKNKVDRGFFHLSRFELYPLVAMPEEAEAIKLMNDAYDKYSTEETNYQMLLGDGPGLYGEAEFNAFDDAVNALTDETVTTVAEAQARVDAAEAALQALIDSRNLEYSIESG